MYTHLMADSPLDESNQSRECYDWAEGVHFQGRYAEFAARLGAVMLAYVARHTLGNRYLDCDLASGRLACHHNRRRCDDEESLLLDLTRASPCQTPCDGLDKVQSCYPKCQVRRL